MKLLFKTPIALPVEKIKEGFTQELFTYISPSVVPLKHHRFDGCKKGDEFHFEFGFQGVARTWIGHITFEETNDRGWSFIDEGKVLPWPLSYWKHQHRVEKVSETESVIIDDIHYECSPSIMAPIIAPVLWSYLAVRPYRYKQYFKA